MQGPILSKAEIDMLLAGIREHGVGRDMTGLADGRDIRPFDIDGLDIVDASRIAWLERINRWISREVSTSFSRLLSGVAEAICDDVELTSYRRLVAEVRPGGVLCAFTLGPLQGRGCLVIDPFLTGLIVDAYFGAGVSARPSAPNALSALSRSALARVADALLDAMRKAWVGELASFNLRDVRSGAQTLGGKAHEGFDAGFVSEGLETSYKQMPVMPDNAPVHLSRFELTLSGHAGSFIIAIPMGSLEPVRSELTGVNDPRERAAWAAMMRQAVMDTPLTFNVEMGSASISAEDFMSLKPGDIIETDKRSRSAIDVLVEGRPVFAAAPGALNGRYAIKVAGAKALGQAL